MLCRRLHVFVHSTSNIKIQTFPSVTSKWNNNSNNFKLDVSFQNVSDLVLHFQVFLIRCCNWTSHSYIYYYGKCDIYLEYFEYTVFYREKKIFRIHVNLLSFFSLFFRSANHFRSKRIKEHCQREPSSAVSIQTVTMYTKFIHQATICRRQSFRFKAIQLDVNVLNII